VIVLEKYKKWTKKEEEELKKLNKENYTKKQIAKKMDRSYFAIASQFRKLKLCKKNSNSVYTKEDDNKLIELKNKGYTYKQIGKELCRTESSINSRVQKLKLSVKGVNFKSKYYKEIEILLKQGFEYKYISKKINISENSIYKFAKKNNLLRQKRWTIEEDNFLFENIGQKTIKYIAKKLNKSESAVYTRADKKGYSNTKELTGMYTANQIAKAFDIDSHVIYKLCNSGRLKHIKKISCKEARYYFLKSNDIWNFVKENKYIFNFKRYKKYSILPEPSWLNEYILKENKALNKLKKWENKDIEILKKLFYMNYSNTEIANIINRSYSSIAHKLNSLGLKRIIQVKWSEKETKMLDDMINKNYSVEKIAYELGREKAHIVCKCRRCNLEYYYDDKDKWTEEEVRILSSMKSKNKRYKEIKKFLPGRTEKSMAWKISQLKRQKKC
jgi:hypothetical protein